MTVMEVVLVSFLGVFVILALVGGFLLMRGKDRAIAANNAEFGHMARQFALALRLEEGDGLDFAALAIKHDQATEPTTRKKRLMRARREKRLADNEVQEETLLDERSIAFDVNG